MSIIEFLPLLAGIGLFLYGMHLLGQALEKVAGSKMEKILEQFISSPLKGVLLGTLVTAIIQSSSATTIMTIGLLNAGIFKLNQAVPVIMGANIGTTITGQLLRLGDMGGDNVIISLFKPSSFGPILVVVGAALILFSKKASARSLGEICIGLGMIFFGMSTMENTISPLSEMDFFKDMVLTLSNPILGILLGAVMTSILQSSSASVGILQAMSSTGLITYATAIPIILGQNIGKCTVVFFAAIGSNKNSKRAVFSHLFINIFGLILFSSVIYTLQYTVGLPFWNNIINRGGIADFNTLFSIITVAALLPFCNKLIDFSKKLIPDDPSSRNARETELAKLDDFLLDTPTMAITQAQKVLFSMGETALQNYRLTRTLQNNYSESVIKEIEEAENYLDQCEVALNNYIVQITQKNLNFSDSKLTTEMFHSISDYERIGDRVINIMETFQYNHENNLEFSDVGEKDLEVMFNAVEEILTTALNMHKTTNLKTAALIEPLEEVIDNLQTQLRARHIERMSNGICDVQKGISFIEILTNLERISDHCSNIAVNVVQKKSNDYLDFSTHSHLAQLHEEPTKEYADAYNHFKERYLTIND